MQWAGCSTIGSEHRNFFISALHGSTALSIDRVTWKQAGLPLRLQAMM